jgi:hypothetical protein
MASIIPDRKLFIVTSALNTDMGEIKREERLLQTIDGLKSLREKVPDAIVLFVDGSPHKVEEEKIKIISDYVDFVADFSSDEMISTFAVNHRKSEAESTLLMKTLLLLKQEPNLAKIMLSVNRVFKLSGRTDLLDSFDIYEHDHFGKYVFKKRIPTWLTDSRKEFATNLLITRMYSFCPSLIDNYLDSLRQIITITNQTRIDTEHAHFLVLNKEIIVELDQIHCQGTVATTNTLEVY